VLLFSCRDYGRDPRWYAQPVVLIHCRSLDIEGYLVSRIAADGTDRHIPHLAREQPSTLHLDAGATFVIAARTAGSGIGADPYLGYFPEWVHIRGVDHHAGPHLRDHVLVCH
jgi:hypothetical protein